jgi:hypothetical protein
MTLNAEEPGLRCSMAIGTNSTFSPQLLSGQAARVGFLFRAKSGRGVRLTSNVNLVPTLKLMEL